MIRQILLCIAVTLTTGPHTGPASRTEQCPFCVDIAVPQTRTRAFLMASRTKTVLPPEPTHAKNPEPTLFGPEPQPWVTMAEALGLDSVNTGRDWKPGGTREDAQVVAGTNPAPTLTSVSGRQWHFGFPRLSDRDPNATYRERDFRSADEPANTVTSKARSAEWHLRHGNERGYGATKRGLDEPAGTLAFGKAHLDWVWQRPATTIMGDSRVWPPGHKVNADDRRRLGTKAADERYGDRAGTEAIRLTPQEALILQTFPSDYPIRGTRTSAFRQIGNAVPVLMAYRILEVLI